jgi:hypothetical protein
MAHVFIPNFALVSSLTAPSKAQKPQVIKSKIEAMASDRIDPSI